jgi:hypothetical protein
MLVVAFYGRQAQLGAHEKLFAAAKLLDLPYYGAFFGSVMDGADVGAEAGGVGVVGDWNEDFDVVGCGAAFELGFCLKGERG